MDYFPEILQQVLQKEIAPTLAMNSIRQIQNNADRVKKSQGCIAYRLSRSINECECGTSEGSWLDVAINLRQAILAWHRTFMLHKKYAKAITAFCDKAELRIDDDGEVTALKNLPFWFGDFSNIQSTYEYQTSRSAVIALGDGILHSMFGFESYSSREQKTAVRWATELMPGHTLLVCLPTGGGKSLVGQYPAYFVTEGGTLSGAIAKAGTTLVVVPTVALAIDQAEAARRGFSSSLSEDYLPTAYYSGIDEQVKKRIYNGIRSGTLPLVYMSPETILGTGFRDVLLDAARKQKLVSLVIDEAHMVSDWGSSFRTDFQFLSSFRQQLLVASGGQLKTILLSATLTTTTTKLLTEMFSEPGKLIEVRGDALRSEPLYFLERSTNSEERLKKTLTILPLLPRPAILYVTSPFSADDWINKLREFGLKSIEAFTSRTKNKDELIRRWNNDQIDIMVATSAFGMGVDKAEIRSVIHCCLPESINSYFQQVGRGGRDGFPLVALISVVDRVDYKEAFSLIRWMLRPETFAQRWFNLYRQSKPDSGDTVWVDSGSRPPHLAERKVTGNKMGEANANINEVTLLFLYRLGLIDIIDINYPSSGECRHILIKLIDIAALEDEDKFMGVISVPRQVEWETRRGELRAMQRMIIEGNKRCWGEFFREVYPYVAEFCNGCPSCRRDSGGGYTYIGSKMRVFAPNMDLAEKIIGPLRWWIGSRSELLLSIAPGENPTAERISLLIKSGIKTIILPSVRIFDKQVFLNHLPNSEYLYMLYDWEEVLNAEPGTVNNGTAAVWYPGKDVDSCYDWTRRFLQTNTANKVLHLADQQLYINTERKLLTELVDGRYPLKLLNELLSDEERTLHF